MASQPTHIYASSLSRRDWRSRRRRAAARGLFLRFGALAAAGAAALMLGLGHLVG